MTRPDKRAARFGKRYRLHLNQRRFTKALRESLSIIRRITERISHPRIWYVPAIANAAAPTRAELEAGTPIGGLSASAGTHSGGDAVDVTDAFRRAGWVMQGGFRPLSSDAYSTATLSPAAQRTRRVNEFVEWADDVLESYDADRVAGDHPWPYESF